MTKPSGVSLTPAVSPTSATPESRSKKLTWCDAWPGVYSTSNVRPPAAMRSVPVRIVIDAAGTGATSPHSRSIASP